MLRSIFFILLFVGCGKEGPHSILSQILPKKRTIITEVDGTTLIGTSRISSPITEEDFAINQIQDWHQVHERFIKHLMSRGIFLYQKHITHSDKEPLVYSPKHVLSVVKKIKSEMPKELLEIYNQKKAFPENINFTYEELSKWHELITDQNEKAIRWQQIITPRLEHFKKQYYRDVRGYLFFKKIPDVESYLDKFNSLSLNKQQEITLALIRICLNHHSDEVFCEKEIKLGHQYEREFPLYQKFFPSAAENYRKFFKLKKKNNFLKFTDSQTLQMNILNMAPDFVSSFTQNVERVWSIPNIFKLKTHFTGGPHLAKIQVKNGTIPYVVDYEQLFVPSLNVSEYAASLAHEVGHLLGFPDCYLEFVHPERMEATYYEIDQSNIMCSLLGFAREEHFHELKKHH